MMVERTLTIHHHPSNHYTIFLLAEGMLGTIGAFNLAFLFVLWSALFSGVAAQAPQPLAPSETRLNEGIKLIGEGRYTEAVTVFSRIKQAAPEDPRPYFYSGLALVEARRLTAAALELGEAVRLGPQRPEYVILQANVLARLKQKPHVDAALASLPEASAAERLDAAWLWLLIDAYFRVERFNDTLRVLDLMEKRFPDDPRLELNRGQVYAIQNKPDLALESLRKSIAKFPGNALAHFELGKVLYQSSDLAGTKKAWLEAVRLEPNNPQYLQRLGVVCLALKETDEAVARLERAAELDPGSSQTNYLLGQAWHRKGARQKASEFINRFQELKRRDDQAEELDRVLARGERMLDEGNETAARAAFEQVVQADPNNWTAHAYLAEMYLGAADWRKAWPHLARMEELDAESVVGNYLLARHWYLRKEFARAGVYAEKVKQLRPAHAELRYLLGQIHLGLGRPEEARREFEEAVRLAPERADFRENLQKLKLAK